MSIEDGINRYDVKPLYFIDSIFFSKKVYSENPVLWVLYPKDSTSFWTKRFLVSDTKISIKFNSKESHGNPIAYCECTNAIEYDKLKGYGELQNLTLPEQQVFESIYTVHPEAHPNADSLRELEKKTALSFFDKNLNFIKENNTLYFSFLLFKEEIIPDFLFSNADTLIKVYNTFPINFKNSFEGREMFNLLQGRIFTKKFQYAPIFTSTDMHGKKITLANYNGKYVLINFWASWCGPCLKELPVLRKIQKDYSAQLQIISVSYDKDVIAFNKAVKKYKMNWVNIFGDEDLINKYGRTVIPALYFLDRKGKVLYNSFEENQNELLSIIKKVIK
ncbi:MAG: TlpA disulfide reductase family protein [Ginsengibacter sp.]